MVFCLMASLSFFACSEDDEAVEEFPNWRSTNESYFNNLYASAQQRIAAGDASWKILTCWSLEESVATNPEDHIIVHVLENGSGTVCPLFTDSANVAYSGRMLPSTSYPSGFVFDKSFDGDFHVETARARGFTINNASLSPGFATALQYMRRGDRWEVYVPSALAYGSEGYSSAGIPGYSTLIFDMTLVNFYHPNGTRVDD